MNKKLTNLKNILVLNLNKNAIDTFERHLRTNKNYIERIDNSLLFQYNTFTEKKEMMKKLEKLFKDRNHPYTTDKCTVHLKDEELNIY